MRVESLVSVIDPEVNVRLVTYEDGENAKIWAVGNTDRSETVAPLLRFGRCEVENVKYDKIGLTIVIESPIVVLAERLLELYKQAGTYEGQVSCVYDIEQQIRKEPTEIIEWLINQLEGRK